MRRLSAAIGRPVTFALLQVDDAPDLWRELMDESLRAVSEGADLWPQVAGRATGLLSGHFTTYCLFDPIPAYQELKAKGLSPDELRRRPAATRACAMPSSRGSPTADDSRPHGAGLPHHLRPRQPARLRAGPRAVARRHRRRQRSDAAVGRLRRHARGRRAAGCSTSPSSTTPTVTSSRPGRCCSTLGPRPAWPTAAPTAGSSATPSQPTFMLTHWTRDRTRGERLPLEWVVKKQTHDTARLYGLGDRGTLEVGHAGRPQRHRLRAPAAREPDGGGRPARRRQAPASRTPPATSRPSSRG